MIFSNLSTKLSLKVLQKLPTKFLQKLPTKLFQILFPKVSEILYQNLSPKCLWNCVRNWPTNFKRQWQQIEFKIYGAKTRNKNKDLNGRKEGCYFEKSRNLESVCSFSIPKNKTIIVIAVLIINGVIFDLMRNRTPFLSLKYLHISLCHFIHTRQPS